MAPTPMAGKVGRVFQRREKTTVITERKSRPRALFAADHRKPVSDRTAG